MKINKLNYENYVIDYIEGTLSIELKKDFDLFLEKNKDVYEEIKDYMSAPIYEETEEVFTNKKAVLKNNITGKYALLALIPIIFLGAYFLMNNITEAEVETTPVVENEEVRTENREPRAESREERGKREARSEKREGSGKREERGNREPRTENRDTEVNQKEVESTEPILNKENFDLKKIIKPSSSEMRFASAEPKRSVLEEEIIARPILNTAVAIGNIDFNIEDSYQRTAKSSMKIASVKTFNESEMKSEKKSNGWLEMITPAAFEDIDLKESLAIQSNKNIDSRKILNAFIPDTVVK